MKCFECNTEERVVYKNGKVSPRCKACNLLNGRRYRENTKEERKKYLLKTEEHNIIRRNNYYMKNKESILEKQKIRREKKKIDKLEAIQNNTGNTEKQVSLLSNPFDKTFPDICVS